MERDAEVHTSICFLEPYLECVKLYPFSRLWANIKKSTLDKTRSPEDQGFSWRKEWGLNNRQREAYLLRSDLPLRTKKERKKGFPPLSLCVR